MVTGILWDLDGTLLDTLQDLLDGVNHALSTFGYPRRNGEEVRRFVGNGAKRLIEQSVPEGADAEPVLAEFREFYNAHCRENTCPYPGITDALEELKREFPMAVVSNKPDSAVKPLCDAYFPGMPAMGERADCPRKPAPDMIRQAMAAIGVRRCIYVGDSEVDVLTAKNAGVPCLSVLWGFRDREALENAGAAHICEEPRELVKKIREMVGMIDGQ